MVTVVLLGAVLVVVLEDLVHEESVGQAEEAGEQGYCEWVLEIVVGSRDAFRIISVEIWSFISIVLCDAYIFYTSTDEHMKAVKIIDTYNVNLNIL